MTPKIVRRLATQMRAKDTVGVGAVLVNCREYPTPPDGIIEVPDENKGDIPILVQNGYRWLETVTRAVPS